MSVGSLAQLRDSYNRIIDATLKKVRDGGLFRGASPETSGEICRKWRAAVEEKLAAMGAAHPDRFGESSSSVGLKMSLADGQVVGTGSAQLIPTAIRNRAPQRAKLGWSFSEDVEAPLERRPLPGILQCPGGFSASQVDSTTSVAQPGPLPQPLPVAGDAQAAIPKTVQEPPVLPPPPPPGRSLPKITASSRPGDPSQSVVDNEDSDDDYSGLFENADTILSQVPQSSPAPSSSLALVDAGPPAAQSGRGEQNGPLVEAVSVEASDGSELGSDLDLPEFEEFDDPPTDNVLHAVCGGLSRKRKKWQVDLREVVLQIDGMECLIHSGKGTFTIDEGFNLPLTDTGCD